MQLTPPKQIVFWISVALAVIGIIGSFVVDPVMFWFFVAVYVLLALGNFAKAF